MLKCKKCGQSNFGVEARQTTAMAFMMVNGEQQNIPGAEPEVKQEVEYKFCFGCNSPITEEDLYEKTNCNTCGNEVDEIIDGNCVECNDKIVKAKALEDRKKALNKMTKAELIEMLLSGELSQEELASAMAEPKKETKAKQEPKVEVAPPVQKPVVEAPVKEEAKNVTAMDNVMPNLEANVEANLNSVEVTDDFLDLGVAPDVNVNVAVDNDEVDILAAIDHAVDIGSLNLQNEGINEQL